MQLALRSGRSELRVSIRRQLEHVYLAEFFSSLRPSASGLAMCHCCLGRELCLVCSRHSVASSRSPFGDSSNISALLNCLILSVHQRRGVRPSSNMRFPCQSVKSGQSPHLFLRMSGIRTCRRGCILQSRCPRARFMVACGCAETKNDLRQENKYKQNKITASLPPSSPLPSFIFFFGLLPLQTLPGCGAPPAAGRRVPQRSRLRVPRVPQQTAVRPASNAAEGRCRQTSQQRSPRPRRRPGYLLTGSQANTWIFLITGARAKTWLFRSPISWLPAAPR